MALVRPALAGVLLAGLPLLPARAQTPPTVTLTVTLTLTLTTPVSSTDTFSAFIGASDTPTEVALCGTGRGAGLMRMRIAYCTAGLSITQRTPIAASGTVPYRFVRFTGPFGPGQRGTTFARGAVTLVRDATISATYPRTVGTVPVTFRLRLHGTVPARASFGVAYPRGGASPEAVPLCTSAAPFIAGAPGGYQRPCAATGLYTTTVRVPIGGHHRVGLLSRQDDAPGPFSFPPHPQPLLGVGLVERGAKKDKTHHLLGWRLQRNHHKRRSACLVHREYRSGSGRCQRRCPC